MAGFRSNNEKPKGSCVRAIRSTVQEFASNTTIHGVTYVFDNAVKALDNILWFFVVCVSAGIAIYMSLDAWNTWKEAPVLTSISSTGLPLQKVDFPAITICSQGFIKVIYITISNFISFCSSICAS